MLAELLSGTRSRLGAAERSFRCCDTDFVVRVRGPNAERAAAEAHRTAESLEARLDAFADDSAVARLNREGSVTDEHVAAVVERGLEYRDRTGGVFDVLQGRVERELKAYIRGETDAPSSVEFDDARTAGDADSAASDAVRASSDPASVSVEGETVRTDRPLDLNGLAKGYVVDRAREALTGLGRTGFVDGGGDVAGPTGPVAVESPYGGDDPLTVLDTDWNVASSAGYRRRRGEVDHVYNPVSERVGTPHDIVTVVARRDCVEADALATTLAALPVDDAIDLAESWGGAEALVVHQGVFHRTEGFRNHVHDAEREGSRVHDD